MGRQQRHDRTETIEKAMTLFWRNGYSGTSMRDLEDCLDMRPGSIYANFGNKEHLYMETLDHYADQNFTLFQQYMENEDSFISGLGRFIAQLIFSLENPCTCMLAKTLADDRQDTKQLREKAVIMLSSFEDSLVAEIDKAKANGEFNVNCNARALARYIQMQILGLRFYAGLQKSRSPLNDLLNDTLESIKNKAIMPN